MSDTTTTDESVHKIHPGLEEFAQPVESLTHHPNNPRVGNVDAIADSLDVNGQMKPIVANQNGVVVAGNHTLRAAKKLGWTHIAAMLLEMTDEQEAKYLLADNRVSDLAGYDAEVLQPLLAELQEAGNLAGTGFTADDVDDLTAELGAVASSSTPDSAEHVESEEETAKRYPSAGNEGGQPTNPQKEIMLMFPATQFDEVAANIKTLKTAWGVEGARDVVAEAVKRAVAAEEASE